MSSTGGAPRGVIPAHLLNGQKALVTGANSAIGRATAVAMTDRMVREFGTIDMLVADAGLQRDAPVTEMTPAQGQKVLDVNLTGRFLRAREGTSTTPPPRAGCG